MLTWRRVVSVACLVVLAAIATWLVVRPGNDDPTTRLDVTWGGSEGHPPCVYDPASQSVEALVAVQFEGPRRDTVSVTVTAYADENTSDLVGTGTGRVDVDVDGTMTTTLHLTIPVVRAPHVDEDGVAACRLAWTADALGQPSAAR